MGRSITRKLVDSHLRDGTWRPGAEIGIQIDQTLMHDVSGPTIVQELEVLGVDRVRTESTVVYVDHNIIQVDDKSAQDHEYLRTSALRLGMWYSPPGNGISHPVHFERFAAPGKTLVGGDSHTVGAGALGMFAMGGGGIDIALATAGEPYYLPTPEVWGVEVTGALPAWVSAKDVILEMLRRHGVAGGVGRVLEYYGPGLDNLSVWDRHVIANMGLELGATATVFPADDAVRRFLEWQGRGQDYQPLHADPDATYDHRERIDLSALEPLVAKPHSPGNVVRVADVAGEPITQAYLGSSANPGYRDFAVVADIVDGQRVAPGVSFDVNPSTRTVLAALVRDGHMLKLVAAGARIHQAGCNGCVGLGQAPVELVASIRTTTRNFKGRSGTADDRVFLASPETIAASALAGAITDPRTLGDRPPAFSEPEPFDGPVYNFQAPLPAEEAAGVEVVRGSNIKRLPRFQPLEDEFELPVLLRLGDDISTEEILPAQQEQVPWRSNIDRISDYAYSRLVPTYADDAKALRDGGGHVIVAGANYGQGSAREHAALSPRFLGLRVVLARSFARIHRRNLVNFGVLPLQFADGADLDGIEAGDVLSFPGLRDRLAQHAETLEVTNATRGHTFQARHELTARQVELVLGGGVLEVMGKRMQPSA